VTGQRQQDMVPPTSLVKSPQEKVADARKNIAYLLVGVYIVLLLGNVILPIVLYLTSAPRTAFSMVDLKDLSSAISGVLGGLVGILGFVVGYYFKSIDDAGIGSKVKRSK